MASPRASPGREFQTFPPAAEFPIASRFEPKAACPAIGCNEPWIFDSPYPARRFPALAQEWHPALPGTPRPGEPTAAARLYAWLSPFRAPSFGIEPPG